MGREADQRLNMALDCLGLASANWACEGAWQAQRVEVIGDASKEPIEQGRTQPGCLSCKSLKFKIYAGSALK